MHTAWVQWWQFRRQALRSFALRFLWMRRGVYIGEGARIPGGGRLDLSGFVSVQRYSVLNARAGATIRIGSGSRIGAFAVISAAQSIDIGPSVLIADRVFVADHHHEFANANVPVIEQGSSSARPVSIGEGCWLGINVCIMPGVTLGPRCVVGAGAVVTQSFPAGSVIGGVPARLIRARLD
jgi:acetyltransferase-like isoleucine patch superfamily enzyme